MRAVITTVAFLLLATSAGVNAQCPTSLTVNNVTFDPSRLAGTLTGQQQIVDGSAGLSFNFAVNLCAKQPECTGSESQGLYFITQLNEGTSTCSKGLFNTMTSAPTASGNSVVASYVDESGLRIANVEVSCGGTSALSSPSSQFTMTFDSATPATIFTFTYQSNLLCGPAPKPTPPSPPSAYCPSSLTVNNVTFDPSRLKGILTGQQQISDGRPGESFDFLVNLCAKQPECAGEFAQGNYFITQLNQSTATCSKGLFSTMTKAPTVSVLESSVVADYVDATGLRLAQVQVFCGGSSALSSPENTFLTSAGELPSTTNFIFKYESNLLCGDATPPVSSHARGVDHHRHKPTVVKRLKKG